MISSNEAGNVKGDGWGANKEKKMKDDEADWPCRRTFPES
jgi:hypothetical protein